MLGALTYTVVSTDEALGWEASTLPAITSATRLSFGDRFCFALAKRLDAPAYTADPAWKEIATALGARVILIR